MLPLTAAQVTEIETICTNFIAAADFVETTRATMQSLTQWRDLLTEGEPAGDSLPAASVFANIGAVTGTIGIIRGPATEGSNVPDLKLTINPGYAVTVKASLKGNDQLRVEYKRNDAADWVLLDQLTTTPATVTISPQTPGQPESGHVRAVFIKRNVQFGSFSPEYPVSAKYIFLKQFPPLRTRFVPNQGSFELAQRSHPIT